MSKKAQLSLDFLLAISLFLFSLALASYYAIVSFIPYQSTTYDAKVCAYRIALLLSEDSGLNVSDGNLSTQWEYSPDPIHTVTRIGLAMEPPLGSSYERSVPCRLNKSKVVTFFNLSWWELNFHSDWKAYMARLIGLNVSTEHGKSYNFIIQLVYCNGTLYSLTDNYGNTVVCQIGNSNSIPSSGIYEKFERLVTVVDTTQNYVFSPEKILRLIVYVW